MNRLARRLPTGAIALSAALYLTHSDAAPGVAAPSCRSTVYLTLDTGNMSHAETIAAILARQQVRATFFLANEATPRGDHALDDAWAPFWRARVAEGHAFGSHTFDHVYFRPGAEPRPASQERAAGRESSALAKPQFGAQAGRSLRWEADAVCREIARVDERFRILTGRGLDPLWRAPGGKAPPFVMDAARGCGWTHVYWAPAGFLGDELPSEQFPNAQLLQRALAGIRDGDVLMAHLGIWSRKDPYAPTLEPLIVGLKSRGVCFETLTSRPLSASALARGRGEPLKEAIVRDAGAPGPGAR